MKKEGMKYSEQFFNKHLTKTFQEVKMNDSQVRRYGEYCRLEGKFETNPFGFSCKAIHNQLEEMAKQDNLK